MWKPAPALPQRSGAALQALVLTLVLAVLALLFAWTVYPGRSQPALREFRVAWTSAQGEVEPNAVLTVTFDRDLLAASSPLPAPAPGLLRLEPESPGTVEWAGRRQLVFRPLRPLPAASPLDLVVSERLEPLAGAALGGPRRFAFNTPALRFLGANQSGYSPDLKATLRVAFSSPVAPEELRSRLNLRGEEDRAVEFEVLSSAPASDLEVRTLEGVTALSVLLAKDLRGTAGPLGLAREVRTAVALNRRLRLVSAAANSVFRGWPNLRLSFNQELARTESSRLKDWITVEPPLEFTASAQEGFSEVELLGKFEPGAKYRVTVKRGLAGRNASVLVDDACRDVVVPDREARVGFRDRGGLLSPQGNLSVALASANFSEVEVRAQRLLESNLLPYLRRGYSWYFPEQSYLRQGPSLRFSLDAARNELAERALDLRELLGEGPKGTWLLTVQGLVTHEGLGQRSASDQVLVSLSNLALTVKRSEGEVLVWVTSLASGEPEAHARVACWSANHQKLDEEFSDADGLVRFRESPSDPDGAAVVVTVEKRGELSFLDLERRQVSLVDFDVRGRPYLREGCEGYLFTDRGVYRPGETVHLSALVRDRALEPPGEFPLEVEVLRPDRKRLCLLRADLSAGGSTSAEWTLSPAARTGRYEARLRLPGDESRHLGTAAFLVEEFMPQRLRASLRVAGLEDASPPQDTEPATAAGEAPARRWRPGEELEIEVLAEYLAGLPAAGAAAELRWSVSPSTLRVPRLADYRFGDARSWPAELSGALGRKDLGEDGKARFELTVPQATGTVPLALRVDADVAETSGRAVHAAVSIDVDLCDYYLGLRGPRGAILPGMPLGFECVAVKPDGAPAPVDLVEVRAAKVEWSSVLRRVGSGEYRYESVREEKELFRQSVRLEAALGKFEVTFPFAGSYEVALAGPEPGPAGAGGLPRFAGARLELWVSNSLAVAANAASAGYRARTGWQSSPELERPEHLKLQILPGRLRPGGTARVVVCAPFAGAALLTVESDHVLDARVRRLERGEQTLDVAIPEEAAGNLYFAATLVRGSTPASPDTQEASDGWQPLRAYGVVPLVFDRAPEDLIVTLQGPPLAEPRSRVPVRVLVAALDGLPQKAEVMLAAVDEGILQSTGFRTPDPWGFFYGRRALDVTLADAFGEALPEVPLELRRARAGGGKGDGEEDGAGDDDALGRRLSPVRARRVQPAALWLGSRLTDDDGTLIAEIELPAQFSGEMRIFAVAHSGQHFGSGARPLTVRAPLHLELGLPRFAAPGDRFLSRADVFNAAGWTGTASLSWELDGALEPAGGRGALARPSRLGAGEDIDLLADYDAAEGLAGGVLRTSDVSLASAAWRGQAAEIEPGQAQRFEAELRAAPTPGVARATVKAALAGGPDGRKAESSETVELAVRPSAPLSSHVRSGTLRHGEVLELVLGSLSGSQSVEGTARQRIVLSPDPEVDLLGSLRYLVQFPHGCLEQTTSRVFPLLYLQDLSKFLREGYGDVAFRADLGDAEADIAPFIDAGIARIVSMQRPDGALGAWGGSSPAWPWGSVYALHFLVEAQRAGHDVDEDVLNALLGYLESAVLQSSRGKTSVLEQAYAAFVLALAGREAAAGFAEAMLARAGETAGGKEGEGDRVLKGTPIQPLHPAVDPSGRFVLPAEARFLLGAALFASRRPEQAREVLGAELPPPSTERDLEGALRSPARESALLLSVVLDVDPQSPWVPALVARLKGYRLGGWWGTTQENAFALLALGKYARLRGRKPSNYIATVRLGDEAPMVVTAGETWTRSGDFSGRTLRVVVEGEGVLTWYIHEEGVPLDGKVEELDRGLRVRRRFLDREGKPIGERPLRQGEVVQVEISAEASSHSVPNVIITDLLAAGLEVENPRLGAVVPPGVQAYGLAVEHLDVRDDRVLIYANLQHDVVLNRGPALYRYAARAVTPGVYSLPAVSAECLYDPGLFSLHGAGKLRIEAQ